jgi:hypothetical protein
MSAKIVVKRMTEVAVKKSDHNNGYYIQAEHWGTCFHRVLTSPNRDSEIDMTYERKPTSFHTYTKFPARIKENVFDIFVCCLSTETVIITLPRGARVIGLDEPQVGQYKNLTLKNQSFMIYCPTGEEPVIACEVDTWSSTPQPEIPWYRHGEEAGMFPLVPEMIFRGRKIQKIFLNPEGYQIKREPIILE